MTNDRPSLTKTEAGQKYAFNMQAIQRLSRLMMSVLSWLSLHPTMPAGLSAIPFEWTVVQRFEAQVPPSAITIETCRLSGAP